MIVFIYTLLEGGGGKASGNKNNRKEQKKWLTDKLLWREFFSSDKVNYFRSIYELKMEKIKAYFMYEEKILSKTKSSKIEILTPHILTNTSYKEVFPT